MKKWEIEVNDIGKAFALTEIFEMMIQILTWTYRYV